MADRHIETTVGHFLCALLCVWTAATGYGQVVSVVHPVEGVEDPFFEDLTVLESLPIYNTLDIVQDRLGFTWLGTIAGLYRYDGYASTLYILDPDDPRSLSHWDIRALLVDSRGTLWVGTANGLNRFDRPTDDFTRFIHNPDDEFSLPGNEVEALMEDARGRLWVGTRGGLGLLDRPSGRFTPFKHDPDNPNSLSRNNVNALCEDRAGHLWIGTWGAGLDRFDPSAATFVHFRHSPSDDSTVSSDIIEDIVEASDGSLWIATGAGLDRFDPILRKFSHLPMLAGYHVLDVLEDRRGTVWITGYLPNQQGDLFQYRPADGTLLRHSYEQNDPQHFDRGFQVYRTYEDSTGLLWMGTYRGPTVRLAPRAKKFETYAYDATDLHTLAFRFPSSIVGSRANEGVLWIGSEVAGLNKLDRAAGTLTSYDLRAGLSPTHKSNWIKALYEDREGWLWIGTRGAGLSRFDPVSGSVTVFGPDPNNPNTLSSDWIISIHESHDGTLWIGPRYGVLNRFDREQGTFTRYSNGVDDYHIYAIEDAHDGKLWLGTNALVEFDPETGRFVAAYKTANPYKTEVWAIHEAASGTVWVGVGMGGLHRLDRDSGVLVPVLTEDNGLPHNHIWALEGDEEGNIWIAGGHGLTRFNPGTGAYQNYDLTDGLPDRRSRTLSQSPHGEMLYGTENGIVTFFPEDVRDNPYVPPVALTAFKLFHESMPPGEDSPLKVDLSVTEEITLSHSQNDFSFEFAALNYRNTEKNRYKYRLTPYEHAWREAGTSREASYMNLRPGTYIFTVLGSNDDGVWNEVGRSIRIVILPPWWRTWWAYALYVVGVLSVVFAGYETRVRNFRKHAVELRDEVAERTRDLVAEKMKTEDQARRLLELDEAKNRLFANISHEFRTPLTLIVGPLQDALDGAFGESSEDLTRQHRVMMRSARRLLRLVNQLLDLSKLQSGKMEISVAPGDLVQFTREIVMSFAPLAERREISLGMQTELDCLACEFDQDVIEKVVSNILSNALKFTTSGDSVSVTLRTVDGALVTHRSATLLPGLPDRVVQGDSADLAIRHSRALPSRHSREAGNQSETTDFATVEITVTDTGPGINREDLTRIFDRFEQVDTTMHRRHEGTGIGLSLAKELTNLHGGELLVESEPGLGSIFTVRLFLKQHPRMTAAMMLHGDGTAATSEATAAAPLDMEPEFRSAGATTNEREFSILIVEDNADVRSHLKRHLASLYQILEAENGQEGLAAACEHMPDLVLSDVMMPVMDGFEMCRLIKANLDLRHIPVIMLTAKAGEEAAIEGIGSGADAYLAKPFSMKELKVRVGALIASRRQLREQFSREIVVKPAGITITPEEEAFLQQVQDVIDEHLGDTTFSVDWLAEEIGMSRRNLERRVKGVVGEPPGALIRRLRLVRGAQLLRASAGTVSEVAYTVGFNSSTQFARAFRKEYGASPIEYVKHATLEAGN